MKSALAFFGAFNPPTAAHIGLAEFALHQTGRELAVFVPSKAVYIRDEQGKDFAYSDAMRLQMLKAAAKTRPFMRVSDWEMRQPRQPRSYETLCHLRDEGIQASLLLGSDKLPELERGWLHVREIAEEFGFVCLTRRADECRRMIEEDPYLKTLSPHITVLDSPEETRNVSSTQVRRLVRELGALVPGEILPLLFQKEEEPS